MPVFFHKMYDSVRIVDPVAKCVLSDRGIESQSTDDKKSDHAIMIVISKVITHKMLSLFLYLIVIRLIITKL